MPSPYINTLCANVAAEDIKDLVYSATTNKTLNITTDLPLGYTYDFDWKAFETLKTPLDDVFGWSPTNRPPIFYKYPVPFNTVRASYPFEHELADNRTVAEQYCYMGSRFGLSLGQWANRYEYYQE